MKNYLKVTVFWVAVLSVWCLKPTKKSQDTLLLQNVEALASGEEPSQIEHPDTADSKTL